MTAVSMAKVELIAPFKEFSLELFLSSLIPALFTEPVCIPHNDSALSRKTGPQSSKDLHHNPIILLCGKQIELVLKDILVIWVEGNCCRHDIGGTGKFTPAS